MSQFKRAFLAFIIGLFVVLTSAAFAAETFPNMSMTGKFTDAEKTYLGIDSDTLTLDDIKAEYLFVDAFSMYCPICQRDAPHLNTVFDEVSKADTEGKIRFLGIGLGNTSFEVAFYQKKFNVAFPIVWDENYLIHKALGEVGTPTFYLVKLVGGSYEILHESSGAIEDTDAFTELILSKAGVR